MVALILFMIISASWLFLDWANYESARGAEGSGKGRAQFTISIALLIIFAIGFKMLANDAGRDHARLTLYRAKAGYDVTEKDMKSARGKLGVQNDIEALELMGAPTATPMTKPLNQPWRSP